MVRGLLERITEMLNIPSSNHGVSDTLSQVEIVDGSDKFDCSKKHIKFEIYAQVYTGTADNTQNERCVEGIALRSSNQQNGYYFMNLQAAKRISSNRWRVLPTPERIIQRVHELAQRERQPIMTEKTMVFEYEPGISILSNGNNEEDLLQEKTDDDNILNLHCNEEDDSNQEFIDEENDGDDNNEYEHEEENQENQALQFGEEHRKSKYSPS